MSGVRGFVRFPRLRRKVLSLFFLADAKRRMPRGGCQEADAKRRTEEEEEEEEEEE